MSIELNPAERSSLDERFMVLRSRQKRMHVWTILGTTAVLILGLSYILGPNVVYSVIGLPLEIQNLDLPYALQQDIFGELYQPNYLDHLLSWVGWLFLKVVISFIGAFVVLSGLKKIRFFQIRLRSLVLRFVGWLICFIVLWGGLSYLQYNWADDESSYAQELIQYDHQVAESELYKYLKQHPVDPVTEGYLIAQMALLHQPQDVFLAKQAIQPMLQLEQKNPAQFAQYQFNLKQWWSIQHQLNIEPKTASVQQFAPIISRAEQVIYGLKLVIAGLGLVLIVLTILSFILSASLKKRIVHIQQRLIE